MDFVEGRDVIIPLEERGGVAGALNGAIVELPDRIDHGMIVSVENVFAIFGVSSDVDLRNAIGGNTVDVDGGIETVILRGDVDIVDVEENATVGAFDNFIEELPFGHFGDVKFGIAGDIFDDDRDFEEVADFLYFLRGDAGGFEGVGHGEKIVGITAIDAAPTKMVGEPRSFGATNEIFEAAEMLFVGFIRVAKIHGDTVLDDFVALENLVEDLERTATIDHEIFGNDFEPVAGGFAGEDVVVVRDAQADADAVSGEIIETIRGHYRLRVNLGREKKRDFSLRGLRSKRRVWVLWGAAQRIPQGLKPYFLQTLNVGAEAPTP